MPTTTDHAYVAVDVPPPTAVPSDGSTLKSKWPVARDLAGSDKPCRLEGEVSDLVVLGNIPPNLSGIFYRIMCDPFVPPHPNNVPIDGDGNLSAFLFEDGKVDFKMRYVETERYVLERRAGKALFGLYRNPFSHHPCVRLAVDSTANTNVVMWADKLMCLKEVACPYVVDPFTLETLEYDPFKSEIESRTFTAHPKIDPYTNELVVFGYEAKGLATLDVVTYTLNQEGKKINELWLKSPWCAFIHDSAITKNWLILMLWPFEANIERMQKGGQHWAWRYDKPVTFIVVPRRKTPITAGWKEGETRYYHWKNCMCIHTAGAWEDEDGTIYLESSRVHDNAFPFFPSEDGRVAPENTKADFVRWKIDPCQPTNTSIPDPQVILDIPSEFPRIDERFMTSPYKYIWLNVFVPENSHGDKNLFHGLNGLAQHNHSNGQTEFLYVGDDSLVQEPIFVPRHEGAEEGDGYVMALVERLKENRSEVIILDTRNFRKVETIVQLPFHVKAQVHGNWIDRSLLPEMKEAFVRMPAEPKTSGKGALNYIE
jgi:carotenoid cleavage dioxygenase-like enzyme